VSGAAHRQGAGATGAVDQDAGTAVGTAHRKTAGEAPQPGPAVVLVGPMGVGKSTVGQVLAERLATTFRDTDTDIVAAAGKPISDIFVDEGESHFRELERRVVGGVRAAHRGGVARRIVATALAEHRGVLALGGGAVLSGDTRALLAGLPVVFLDMGVAEAVRRVGLDAPRPLLVVNPRQRWRELMAERRPLYTEVARAVVATDGRTPQDVAEAALDALELKQA
jgi:shikimate kinase